MGHDGLIAAVGYNDVVEAELPGATYAQVVDASGKAVLPGLVDAHTHPVWAGDRVHEFALKVSRVGGCVCGGAPDPPLPRLSLQGLLTWRSMHKVVELATPWTVSTERRRRSLLPCCRSAFGACSTRGQPWWKPRVAMGWTWKMRSLLCMCAYVYSQWLNH